MKGGMERLWTLSVFFSLGLFSEGAVMASGLRGYVLESLEECGITVVRQGFEELKGELYLVFLCSGGLCEDGMEGQLAELLCSRIGRSVSGTDRYVGQIACRVVLNGLCCPLGVYVLASVAFGGWEDGICFQDGVEIGVEGEVVREELKRRLVQRVGYVGCLGYQSRIMSISRDVGMGCRCSAMRRLGGYIRIEGDSVCAL